MDSCLFSDLCWRMCFGLIHQFISSNYFITLDGVTDSLWLVSSRWRRGCSIFLVFFKWCRSPWFVCMVWIFLFYAFGVLHPSDVCRLDTEPWLYVAFDLIRFWNLTKQDQGDCKVRYTKLCFFSHFMSWLIEVLQPLTEVLPNSFIHLTQPQLII